MCFASRSYPTMTVPDVEKVTQRGKGSGLAFIPCRALQDLPPSLCPCGRRKGKTQKCEKKGRGPLASRLLPTGLRDEFGGMCFSRNRLTSQLTMRRPLGTCRCFQNRDRAAPRRKRRFVPFILNLFTQYRLRIVLRHEDHSYVSPPRADCGGLHQ